MYNTRDCAFCGKTADHYCDACGRHICEDHIVEVQIRRSPRKFILCPECAKKKRKPVDPFRVHHHPSYRD